MTLAESLFNRRVSVKDTRIRDTALHYARLKRSVIPVVPETKKALIRWKKYQTEPMSATDIQKHFDKARGLAVVCGSVSGVLCADFDKIEAYHAFKHKHPDLADTYTEQTPRGGMHAFYALGDDIANISTAQGKKGGVNGDLIANGGYVLVSPTPRYEVVLDTAYTQLSADGLEVLKRYLGIVDTDGTPTDGRHTTERDGGTLGIVDTDTAEPTRANEHDVIAEYHRLADMVGRNNALYRVACDVSAVWSLDFAKSVLVPIHANKPPTRATATDTAENIGDRRNEAIRTIQSAYKHGARRAVGVGGGLPNELRERLLSAPNGATVARVLDALYFVGVSPARTYTEKQLCELVALVGIGRHTLRTFLDFARAVDKCLTNATATDTTDEKTDGDTRKNDANVFCLKMSPKQTFVCLSAEYLADKNRQNTKHPQNTAHATATDTTPSADVPSKKGRRATVFYTVLSLSDLCQAFNVTNTRGDAVTMDMLGSVSAYRSGLHLALVKRYQNTDKIYSRGVLSRRLGVNARSLRRYEQSRGINAEPILGERVMTFSEVSRISTPDNEPRHSYFVDIDGKRYAYVGYHKTTFAKAIANGKRVTVRWWRGVKLSTHTHTATHISTDTSAQAERVTAMWTPRATDTDTPTRTRQAINGKRQRYEYAEPPPPPSADMLADDLAWSLGFMDTPPNTAEPTPPTARADALLDFATAELGAIITTTAERESVLVDIGTHHHRDGLKAVANG